MNITTCLEYLTTHGVALAELFHHDPNARFGLSERTVRQYRNLGEALFGKLSDPIPRDREGREERLAAERALRAEAVVVARREQLSVEKLYAINTAVAKRLVGAEATREELRLELTRIAGELSVEELKTRADARVREANQKIRDLRDRACKQRYYRSSRNPDALGMRHAMIKLPEDELNELDRRVHAEARRIRHADPELTADQANADAFVRIMRGGGWPPEDELVTCLVIMEDAMEADDGVFAKTDGTIMTAEEVANRKLAKWGLCAVYDKNAQPVKLMRMERFANAGQRQLMAVDQIVCSYPSCYRPATDCEAHHLESWANGGETNLDNLTLACRKHHGWNDDDPQRPKNGRFERDPESGAVGWKDPAPDSAIRVNDIFPTKFSAGTWARKRRDERRANEAQTREAETRDAETR